MLQRELKRRTREQQWNHSHRAKT